MGPSNSKDKGNTFAKIPFIGGLLTGLVMIHLSNAL